MSHSKLPMLAIPVLAAALALSACAEANAPPPENDTTGNALTDGDDINTAPVTQPEGAVDPDGLGPDEAFGDSGNENPETTNIDDTGEAMDIPNNGKPTEVPKN